MALSEQEIRDLIAKYENRNKQIAAADLAMLDLILAGGPDAELDKRLEKAEADIAGLLPLLVLKERVDVLETALQGETAERVIADATERQARFDGDAIAANRLNAQEDLLTSHDERLNVLDSDIDREAQARVTSDAELYERIAALEKEDPPPPPPPADADFTWQPTTPKVGEAVIFNVIDPKPEVAYAWDRTLDGGHDVTGPSFAFTYQGVGTKTVRLYANNVFQIERKITVVASEVPPPTGDAIPTFDGTMYPGVLNLVDNPASDYHGYWIYPTSPTTPYRSPDSRKTVERYLLLDSRYRCADGHQGHDDWWFIIERLWPSAPVWDPTRHGKWGRPVNFHTVAGDAGPPGSAGVGWSFGEGSSPLALDWLNRPEPTVTVQNQAETRNMPLPVPKRDEWQTYVMHWVAGRTDGSTLKPGSIEVWVNGQKVIDRQRINTLQRSQGPDGQWYVPRWVQLWEGDYTSALPQPQTHRLALVRIGRTLQEALADRPTVKGTNFSTMYRAYGSGPLNTLVAVSPPRLSGEAKVPVL